MGRKKCIRRDFLKQAGGAIAAASLAAPWARAAERRRPNFVFLLGDDLTFTALGCMGNKQAQTPNMDQLGADGMIFDRYYNTTAICMASRACIMTGMHEYKTGCNFTYGPLAADKFERSYPVLLREAGYFTGFAGKFGFGVAKDDASSNAWKSPENMPKDKFDWWAGWPGQGTYNARDYLKKYADKYPHTTRALGAAGCDFLQEAAAQDKPFCLSVSFKAPHSPVSPDPEFASVYEGVDFTKPPNFGPDAATHLSPQSKSGRQFQSIGKSWCANADTPAQHGNEIKGKLQGQNLLAHYYRQVYGVDVAIGMIRKELERLGLADNTVVFLTGDNGYSCGAHGFGGKVLPYEEAARAPMLIYDPRAASAGKRLRTNAVTANIDVAPTILDMAGVDIPDTMDGTSLAPLLDVQKKRVRDTLLLTQVWGPATTHALTMVSEDWKYIYWHYGDKAMKPKEELFNMRDDRYEMTDESSNPECSQALKRMRARYDDALATWKKNCIQNYGYPELVDQASRAIGWEKKTFGKLRKKKIQPEK